MANKAMEIQRKRLVNAFQFDCKALLTRFELTYNTHFQNFCEIWREMQFSSIFDCQPTQVTLDVFHGNALCITKQLLVNASDLKESVGALYLMYSVYYMLQPSNAKIRMTLSDWKCLMNLHQRIKVEKYLDANYVLCKLIADCAFVHCISDKVYGIEKHFVLNKEKLMLDNILPDIKELAAPGKLLSQIEKLSKIYEAKKRTVVEKDNSSVQLYDANMPGDVIKSIRAMQSESIIRSQDALYENIHSVEPTSSTLTSTSTLVPASASTSTSTLLIASASAPLPTASTSASSSVPASNSNRYSKRSRKRRKQLILSKIGKAFDTALKSDSEKDDLSEGDVPSEDELYMNIDICDLDPSESL